MCYDGVRQFFVTTYEYDPFIKSCIFVYFDYTYYVQTIIFSFTRIHSKLVEESALLNTVEEEFMDHQSLTKEEISPETWENAKVGDGSFRMDVVWGFLKTILPIFSEIAMSVLVIPHNNAGEEKVFSVIGKNKTEFRSRVSLGRSLNSIMILKSTISESLLKCHEWKALLQKCKSATTACNEEHSSSK